jgi:DNA-binding GntR family transcriptional regulator
MTEPALRRESTVDQLAAALRERILDGELAPGRRLVERELVEAYDVARHTLRAALRQLQVEGLVRVEPNRGARVAALSPDDLGELFALRLALEREAAHLALERGDGRLPPAVHDGAQRLHRLAARRRTSWNELSRAHEAVHRGLVAAGGAPRVVRAYDALSTELALFLSQLRPVWARERLGPDHVALVRDIERDGPDALREHMAQALRALGPGSEPAPLG